MHVELVTTFQLLPLETCLYWLVVIVNFDYFIREQWIQDAEDAEKAGSVKTCQSIIKHVIGNFSMIDGSVACWRCLRTVICGRL